jgi:hypothetical protein
MIRISRIDANQPMSLNNRANSRNSRLVSVFIRGFNKQENDWNSSSLRKAAPLELRISKRELRISETVVAS